MASVVLRRAREVLGRLIGMGGPEAAKFLSQVLWKKLWI